MIIAEVLLSAAILAQAQSVQAASELPLVVFSDKEFSSEIFRMEPGACLRGPLQFMNREGAVTFRLERGITFPAGCAEDTK